MAQESQRALSNSVAVIIPQEGIPDMFSECAQAPTAEDGSCMPLVLDLYRIAYAEVAAEGCNFNNIMTFHDIASQVFVLFQTQIPGRSAQTGSFCTSFLE